MIKLLAGAFVGGILLFAWQTLSWMMLDLHGKEYQYTPNQESVMQYLNSQFTSEGQYLLPNVGKDASMEEHDAMRKSMEGKPWALISYHKAYDSNMMTMIIRGFLACFVAALFVCWVLMKNTRSTFFSTFISCILIGLAAYLFFPYTGIIWFKNPGADTFLIDAVASWGLCGLWLGWWLNRK